MSRALTVGEDEFKQANSLVGAARSTKRLLPSSVCVKKYPGDMD